MRLTNLYSTDDSGNLFSAVVDWDTLGHALGIERQIMAYAYKYRGSLQHRIEIGDRTVYKSDDELHDIQEAIGAMLAPVIDTLPDNDVIRAYRPRVGIREITEPLCGSFRQVRFDIVHYFDNIKHRHIVESLKDLGFTESGAEVVAHYCLVKRKSHGVDLQSLQQGSCASPVLSNIVGAKYIDAPILKWLRECEELNGIEWRYARYCDNISLFLWDRTSESFYTAYKTFVREALQEFGFRTHEWRAVTRNNPVWNIRFLGVVLNGDKPRISRRKYRQVRSMIYNACTHGVESQAARLFADCDNPAGTFIARLTALVSYESQVNNEQAAPSKRLVAAMRRLYRTDSPMYSEQLKLALNSYKEDCDPRAFADRVVDAMYEGYDTPIRPIG